MRKTFTTIALFAVLGSLAVSCQKENIIDETDTYTHSGFNQIWFYSNSFEDTVFVFIDSINYRYSCSVFNNSDYCLQFWNMESGYLKLMNDTIHLYGIWGQKDYLLREIDSCSVLLKYIGYINMQNYPIIITDYLFTKREML